MDKRYQVSVNSTYGDLRAERQDVTQALLEADYISPGMELFRDTIQYRFKIDDPTAFN